MADTKFMSFAEVTPDITDSVLVANETNGVRRARLNTLKEVIGATAMGCGGIIAYSSAENGYVKFANGLILQWGVTAETWREAGSYEQKFPISFQAVPHVLTTAFSENVVISVPGINTTSFSYQQNVRNYNMQWVAIGF